MINYRQVEIKIILIVLASRLQNKIKAEVCKRHEQMKSFHVERTIVLKCESSMDQWTNKQSEESKPTSEIF